MNREALADTTEAAIWTRVIHPDGELSEEAARTLLQLEFPEADQHRAHELALKAQEGSLTAEEEAAIENYQRVGTLLAILKSKARQLLKPLSPPPLTKRMDADLEQLVRERAGGLCEYCRIPEERDRPAFEFEHIVAKQHGGKTVASNLAHACFTCNHRKGPNLTGIDPRTAKITPLFHPRRHKWERHFRWDGPVLLGRTAIGRATIAVLGINLPLRVRLRQELIKEGVFPPQG